MKGLLLSIMALPLAFQLLLQRNLEENQASALFWYSVASAGDVNGDGYSDVIVGAYVYDNGQSDEGAAFIYHGSSSGLSTTAASQLEANQVSAYLGYSVASAGDVNGDGYSDVIVGALSTITDKPMKGLLLSIMALPLAFQLLLHRN